MPSLFTPLALICASQDRLAVPDGRRTRPGHRLPERNRTRTRFQLEGLEQRCLLSGISGFTEFPLASGSSAYDITAGPDGNLWFTDLGAGKIGMVNPTTHAISEFSTPTANSHPWGITAGPDGNLWFTEETVGKIGMINPTTHAISEFKTSATSLRGITVGPDGNLWFAEFSPEKIGMINPTTHKVSEFSISTSATAPWGITAGADGNVWFTEWTPNNIAMMNPTTHATTAYALPSGDNGSRPYGITAGPDGNIWFTDTDPGQIGTINLTTDAISVFAIPTGSQPVTITAGPDGNLWFTDSGQIGRINPTTDAITEYPVPVYYGMTTGPDGNLWFTDGGNIGVATLSATETDLVVTQQPPSSVTAGSAFGLTVEAEDGSGNLVTSFNGMVTVALASNPGGATLGGTLSVQASGGVATFAGLTLNKAASGYALAASSGVSGLGFTGAITVTPAVATQLVITQQPPSTVKVSSPFGIAASIEDQYGNVVTTAGNIVNVTFANNATGATLGGTLSVWASQGVATFSGLTINKVGSGYTLQVSSSGLSSAVTSAISVTKTGKTPSPLSAPAVTVAPDPLLAPLVLDSLDFLDSLGTKKRTRRT